MRPLESASTARNCRMPRPSEALSPARRTSAMTSRARPRAAGRCVCSVRAILVHARQEEEHVAHLAHALLVELPDEARVEAPADVLQRRRQGAGGRRDGEDRRRGVGLRGLCWDARASAGPSVLSPGPSVPSSPVSVGPSPRPLPERGEGAGPAGSAGNSGPSGRPASRRTASTSSSAALRRPRPPQRCAATSRRGARQRLAQRHASRPAPAPAPPRCGARRSFTPFRLAKSRAHA